VREHLKREARVCYVATLLYELSKAMRFKPKCEGRHMCIPMIEEMKYYAAKGDGACDFKDQYEVSIILFYAPKLQALRWVHQTVDAHVGSLNASSRL
jgi:hypothetical protein